MSIRPEKMIVLNENGFALYENNKPLAEVYWNKILKIIAFKRNLYATDLICLALDLEAQNAIEIDEEMPGFSELLKILPQKLSGLNKDWYDSVAHPAFEPNITTVWEKEKEGI